MKVKHREIGGNEIKKFENIEKMLLLFYESLEITTFI